MRKPYTVSLAATSVMVLVAGFCFERPLLAEPQAAAGSQWVASQQSKLPPDVHADTLSRATRPKASDFTDPDDQKSFTKVSQGDAGGKWLGPSGTRLQVPPYADNYESMSRELDKYVEKNMAELVNLVSAREAGNQALYLDHYQAALKANGKAVLEIVRLRKSTKGLDPKQAAVIEYAREMFKLPMVAPISAKVYADMETNFGKQGTLAITALMMGIQADNVIMRAYDQHMDTSAGCKGSGCLNPKDVLPLWDNPKTAESDMQTEAQWAKEQANLPPGIFPETLCRIPRVKESDFTTDEDKEAFDKVNNAPGSKQLVSRWLGPTGMRLQIPVYAVKANAQNKAFRSKSGVDTKYMELAAGVATRENGSREQYIDHIEDGIKAYGEQTQEIIQLRKDPAPLDAGEIAIIEFARDLYKMPRTGPVSSQAFANLEKNFGARGAMGIIALMAYYDGNLMLIRTYDQHMDTRPNCSGSHMGCMDMNHLPPAW